MIVLMDCADGFCRWILLMDHADGLCLWIMQMDCAVWLWVLPLSVSEEVAVNTGRQKALAGTGCGEQGFLCSCCHTPELSLSYISVPGYCRPCLAQFHYPVIPPFHFGSISSANSRFSEAPGALCAASFLSCKTRYVEIKKLLNHRGTNSPLLQ